MAIAKELLLILACPRCKGDVKYDKKGKRIICNKCRLRYPVIDDIPVMLVEDAEKF